MTINLTRKANVFLLLCFLIAVKTEAQDNGDPFYDRQPGNSLHAYEQYLKTNSQEHINPATGGLTITATDISLPGRNGLDLNISRVYRSRHLVAPYPNLKSEMDFIPQWSNLGMGWKCFMAVLEVNNTVSAPAPQKASLFMGNGSVHEFYSDNGGTNFYACGPEKYRMKIQNGKPVLYLPNGFKYYFGMKSSLVTWGFYYDHYCVTKIQDANGNYISIHYLNENITTGTCPGTEIDYIIDTWGRKICFYWDQDSRYSPIGTNMKYRLTAIKVFSQPNSNPYMSIVEKSYTYTYDTLSMGYTERVSNGIVTFWWQGQVSVLNAVFSEDKCVTRYQYGATNGHYDYSYDSCKIYQPNNATNPNADRGQLVKVLYPSGACDRYFYKLIEDEEYNIYSSIEAKGNADYDDLWKFEYLSDANRGSTILYKEGYWLRTKVSNTRDSTCTIYQYSSPQDKYCYPTWSHIKVVPLLMEQKDSSLTASGADNKTVKNFWTKINFDLNNVVYKVATLLNRVEVKENGQTTSYKTYAYPSSYNQYNYDNCISSSEDMGNGQGLRITNYGYLHLENPLKYCNDTIWIVDRKTSQKVYYNSRLLSSLKYEYDALPCSLYNYDFVNFNLDTVQNDVLTYNHSAPYSATNPMVPRGNVNKSVSYLISETGMETDPIVIVSHYDVYGNRIMEVNGKGDTTFFYYDKTLFNLDRNPTQDNVSNYLGVIVGYKPGTGYAICTADALLMIGNSEYGISKVYEYSVLGQKISEIDQSSGKTTYQYEPIYLRPQKTFREGDNLQDPAISYEYQDRDRDYYAWDFSYLQGTTLNPPAEPIIYTAETHKQDDGKNQKPIYRYYNRNGYLKKQVQGNIQMDYTFNTLGLLTSETAPYFIGTANPPKTRYIYDGLKRLKKAISPDGAETKYNYGPLYREITDANGNTTRYEFDMAGRLVKVIDALGQSTVYEYDALDHLTRITTGDGKTSAYTYDSYGRLKTKRDPDAGVAGFWYDKAGNLVKYRDAALVESGGSLIYKYDRIGRLVSTWALGATGDSTVVSASDYDNYGFLPIEDMAGPTLGESLEVFNGITQPIDINYSIDGAAFIKTAAPAPRNVHMTYQPSDTFPKGDWRHTMAVSLNKLSKNESGWCLMASIDSDASKHYNFMLGLPFFGFMNGAEFYYIRDSLCSPYVSALKPGAIINAAYLNLYQLNSKADGYFVNARLLYPFDETCINYGTMTNYYYAGHSSIQIDTAYGWKVFNIKNICTSIFDSIYYDENIQGPCFAGIGFYLNSISGKNIIESGIDIFCAFDSGDSIRLTGGNSPVFELNFASADATPPNMRRLFARTFRNTCALQWEYDNDWTADTVDYGISSSYGSRITPACTSMTHSAALSDLLPGQQYHFRVISRDVTGNRTVSPNYTFRTDDLRMDSYRIHELTPYSARLSWILSYPTPLTVRYGTDPQCAQGTIVSAATAEGSAYLSGLLPSRKYYFQLSASVSGQTYASPLGSFTTPGVALFAYPVGKLTRATDQSGETVYGYDQLGRTVTRRVGINDAQRSYCSRYGYDRADNVTSFTYPDGDFKKLSYDSYNRLSAVKDRNEKTVKSFGYTAAGACSTESYPNGVGGVYSYHPRLWLKNAALSKGTSKYFNHAYNYDNIGNLLADNDNTGLTSSINRGFTYDALNRLATEASGSKIPFFTDAVSPIYSDGYLIAYQYDAMGNRTRAGTTTYQYYPGTNRLQNELVSGIVAKSYGYDANGNMNNDGIWNYEYDAQNKLKKVYKYVSNGSTNIEYLYNSSGLRVKEKKTDVVSNTGGTTLAEATFPETFDDLIVNAPSGDGHDDARDLGKLKVHVSDSFLFFTIEHKYLYGTSQGDYENIYICMDTDQEFGSGSTLLPDDIKVSVSADNAWEYCAYVYSEKDFGIYIGEGFKLENLTTAGGKKMKVNFTNGHNSKAIIKIPLELIGNARKIRFAIISTMPGAPSYVETSVCDVLPGGRLALDGTLITQYNEFVAPAPGTSITTVETKYNLYDDGGQVLCDLDEYGNITKRYVYAGGKHVAMDLPGNKDYMTNGGFEYGNYEYPLTPWYKWAPDGQTSAVNWQIVSDVKRTGTYSAKATAFSAASVQNYAQNVSLPALPFIASCYMKAQDLTGGVYLLIECWSAGYGSFLGNVTSNLKTGTFDWSLISIPVNALPEGTGAIKVTIQRLQGTGTVWVDDVRCEEGVSRKEDKSYYYHCDYLGSPRVMTDQLGNVIWRQDYYAFGGDYASTSLGNTHKFTGHVQDAATGQYYAKARYFTTGLGRWTQPEPLLKGVPPAEALAEPQSLNPYVYCQNNPLKYTDPDGNWIQLALLAGAYAMAISADPVGFQSDLMQMSIDQGNTKDMIIDAVALAVPILGAATLKSVVRGGEQVVEGVAKLISKADAGKAVLGKFPDYIKLADEIGAKRFNMPTEVWNKMGKAEQWAANQKFLDRVIKRGDKIILSNPVKNVKDASGFFRKELDYLLQNGYRLSEDGTQMMK
jgi:RHS repeat-associated protein